MTNQDDKSGARPVTLRELQQRVANISEANTVDGLTFMAQLIAGKFDTDGPTAKPEAKN